MLASNLPEIKSLDLQCLLLSKRQILSPWPISSSLHFNNQPPWKFPAYLTTASSVELQWYAHHWKKNKSLSPKRIKQWVTEPESEPHVAWFLSQALNYRPCCPSETMKATRQGLTYYECLIPNGSWCYARGQNIFNPYLKANIVMDLLWPTLVVYVKSLLLKWSSVTIILQSYISCAPSTRILRIPPWPLGRI